MTRPTGCEIASTAARSARRDDLAGVRPCRASPAAPGCPGRCACLPARRSSTPLSFSRRPMTCVLRALDDFDDRALGAAAAVGAGRRAPARGRRAAPCCISCCGQEEVVAGRRRGSGSRSRRDGPGPGRRSDWLAPRRAAVRPGCARRARIARVLPVQLESAAARLVCEVHALGKFVRRQRCASLGQCLQYRVKARSCAVLGIQTEISKEMNDRNARQHTSPRNVRRQSSAFDMPAPATKIAGLTLPRWRNW